jgi:hypothetical protein
MPAGTWGIVVVCFAGLFLAVITGKVVVEVVARFRLAATYRRISQLAGTVAEAQSASTSIPRSILSLADLQIREADDVFAAGVIECGDACLELGDQSDPLLRQSGPVLAAIPAVGRRYSVALAREA